MIKELEIEFEKRDTFIRVEYSVKIDDQEIEFSGTLKPYHTGRDEEYEFEPGYFTNEASEKYYDDNWDKIEEQILDAFYMKKYKKGGIMKSRSKKESYQSKYANRGTSWTLDHNQHNKKESYEIPLNKRKSKSSQTTSSSSSSTKRKRYTYIPNGEIESITTWNGKEIKGSELLDGAYAKGNVKYADGGMMAKGGMSEHGLQKGDKIIDTSYYDENTIIVSNDGKSAFVNLNKGERYAEGGEIEKITCPVCKGDGEIFDEDIYKYVVCFNCDGEGYVMEEEEFAEGGMMAKGGMVDIETGDDIKIMFIKDTILDIYEDESQVENLESKEEYFKAGEIIEVNVYDFDDRNFAVQFGDGSISFIMKGFVKIVEINGDPILPMIYNTGGNIDHVLVKEVGEYKIYYNKSLKNYAIEYKKRIAPAFESIEDAELYIKSKEMEYAEGGMMEKYDDDDDDNFRYDLVNEISEDTIRGGLTYAEAEKLKSEYLKHNPNLNLRIYSTEFADGGMMAKGGRTYQSKYANRGASWTLDHYQFNKKEGYEKPLAKRKRL